jgi:hypothetical protein
MNLRTPLARRMLAFACAAVCVPAAVLASSAAVLASSNARAAVARTAAPACATAGLDLWLDTGGSGAAGTIYYQLHFTNLSGGTCTLLGYPGVSGVTLTGTQLGSAAGRNHSVTPHLVTLTNGATATAIVGIVQVSLFQPAKCGPVTAAGLRVYPPGQTASKIVPFPFGACSKTGPGYLSTMAVK